MTGLDTGTDGLFSKTAYRRLPPEVRALPEEAQTVCIFMRMRHTAEQIAAETGLPPETVAELTGQVEQALIQAGKYHLVSDPVFVPLAAQEEAGHEPQAAALSAEDDTALRRFLTALTDALEAMPRDERRMLHLYFHQRMTPAAIADFYRTLGRTMDADDAARGVARALNDLLQRMNGDEPLWPAELTVSGLKAALYETGVPE